MCCATTLKQALCIRERDPEAQVYIVYKDMRTPGQAEEFYRRVQEEEGVFFTKGEVTGVLWDSPAFDAGLTVSTRILAVDGFAYTPDRLKAAVTAGKAGAPIRLTVRNGEHFGEVSIDYRGGLRYPRLERTPGTPDLLTAIYSPK